MQKNGASPWHARESLKVAKREISFRSYDGVRLSGTAYIPSRSKNLPGIVALHGASTPTRDAELYSHLKEGLPRIGFALLVFDRRGNGKSKGEHSADYETLARDAIAGKEALGRIAGVDSKKIGFWGISQGGWIATMATRLDKHPTFAIAVSAPLVTVERQMEFACSNLLKVRGYEAEVKTMLMARKAWLDYLRGRITLETASREIRRVERKTWFKLAFMPGTDRLESSQGALKEMEFDSTNIVSEIKVPLLFIYGGEDPWVPVQESIGPLEEIIARGSHDITYAIIPGANHEMNYRSDEKMVFEKGKIEVEAPEASSYFMLMGSWLSRTVK